MNNIGELVDRYFRLAPISDADPYFAQFAASVEDEGRIPSLAIRP
jgi:hypothetical protein